MNKKVGGYSLIIIFVIIGFVFLTDVSGQTGGLGEGVMNATEDLQEAIDERRWEYLGEEWKEILLNNKAIEIFDSGMRKINFLYVFLFAEDYDLSITLVFAILLWIFFFTVSGKTLAVFATFSKWVSWVIAFIITVILAHLGVFEGISLLLFKVIFYKEGIWGWISFVIFLVAFILFTLYLQRIIYHIGRMLIKNKEAKEKWDEKFQREIFRIKVKGIEEAFSSVGGALSELK